MLEVSFTTENRARPQSGMQCPGHRLQQLFHLGRLGSLLQQVYGPEPVDLTSLNAGLEPWTLGQSQQTNTSSTQAMMASHHNSYTVQHARAGASASWAWLATTVAMRRRSTTRGTRLLYDLQQEHRAVLSGSVPGDTQQRWPPRCVM